MEEIKKYLEHIHSDENQIKDFLEANETKIKEFFKNLWEKQFVSTTAPEIAEAPEVIDEPKDESTLEQIDSVIDTNENQTQDNMEKFASNEKLDKEKALTDAMAFKIKNKQITFTNGKVNQQYEVDFNFTDLDFAEIIEVSFNGLEQLGLEYLPDQNKIKGLPTEAGDHKVKMLFKIKNYEDRPPLEREVIFIINPDPRVLWSKNIPTLHDIEYYKPDSHKKFVKVKSIKDVLGFEKKDIARKNMVAASQRGRSHAINGSPRDDDYDLCFDEQTEWYAMVVSDGAGSAKYSREGSKIACQKAMEVCKEQLLLNKEAFAKNQKAENKNEVGKVIQGILSKAVFDSYKAIEKEAAVKQTPIKDYSTTLILSLCKKMEYGWFIAAWWVGDGGIGVYNKEAQYLKILGEPDGGEFAGQTRFLTMTDIIQNELYSRMRFDVVDDFTALVLMSDGITDPKFETDANLGRIEKWNELWADLGGDNEDQTKVDFTDDNEAVAEQLLKWLDFWSKGNHDDRTIAILF